MGGMLVCFACALAGQNVQTGGPLEKPENLLAGVSKAASRLDANVKVRKNKTYRLSFSCNGDPLGWCSGVQLSFDGGKPWRPYYPLVLGKEWKRKNYHFIAPGENLNLKFFPCSGGKSCYDQLELAEAPLPESVMVKNGLCFNYEPRQAVPDAPLKDVTPEEKERGYLVYFRGNPRDTYADSIPKRSEVTGAIEIRATPGEYEPAFFSVYALKDLKNIRIQVSDFSDDKGGKISRENVDVRTVKCWPQRTAYNTLTYYNIPELLEKRGTLDVPRNSTQTFYLIVKVPEDSRPGRYRAAIHIAPEGCEKAMVNLHLETLPFKLEKPVETGRYMYLDYCWNDRSFPFEIGDVLADLKQHGVDGLWLYLSRFKPNGFTLQWSADNKRIEAFNWPALAELQALRKKHGMKGPLVLSGNGGSFELAIKEHLKLKMTPSPNRGEGEWLGEEQDQEWFRQLYRDACQSLDRFIRETGGGEYGDWVFEGVDEPTEFTDRRRQAMYQMTMARDAGLKTQILCDVANDDRCKFIGKIAPFLKNIIFTRQFCANAATNRKCLEMAGQTGCHPWFYGDGCYSGNNEQLMQEGGLMPNRLYNGFLMWKSRAKGKALWLYTRFAGGSPHDDFDNLNYWEPKDCMIVYPGRENPREIIPTLQWEGSREGIDDYHYLHTLQTLIRKAKSQSQGKAASRAQEIEGKLAELLERIPWLDDYSSQSFDNAAAKRCRDAIADWIVELMRLMERLKP